MDSLFIKLKERYNDLMHAMQTGVATKMCQPGSNECSPKHLRVGVNSVLISEAALASILIKKGIITELEYLEALVEFAERDVKSYEQDLEVEFGKKFKLI